MIEKLAFSADVLSHLADFSARQVREFYEELVEVYAEPRVRSDDPIVEQVGSTDLYTRIIQPIRQSVIYTIRSKTAVILYLADKTDPTKSDFATAADILNFLQATNFLEGNMLTVDIEVMTPGLFERRFIPFLDCSHFPSRIRSSHILKYLEPTRNHLLVPQNLEYLKRWPEPLPPPLTPVPGSTPQEPTGVVVSRDPKGVAAIERLNDLTGDIVDNAKRWKSTEARKKFKDVMSGARTQPQIIDRDDDEIVVISRLQLENYANPKSVGEVMATMATALEGLPFLTFTEATDTDEEPTIKGLLDQQ